MIIAASFPAMMPKEFRIPKKRLESAERSLNELKREVGRLGRKLVVQDQKLSSIAKEMRKRGRREAVVMEALSLSPRSKVGDRGILGDLSRSILRLEEHLLKTSERIESILEALKSHREFLVKMNKRFFDLGTRERIRLELDVMRNTLSILALNGVDFDQSLLKDIDKLKSSLEAEADVGHIQRSKENLDKKFEEELKRFDLDAIFQKKKEIPGYR